MTRADELSTDLYDLVVLADEIGRLHVDCGPTRDILDRLHREIRVIFGEMARARPKGLIEDAAAVLRVAHNSGPLQ